MLWVSICTGWKEPYLVDVNVLPFKVVESWTLSTAQQQQLRPLLRSRSGGGAAVGAAAADSTTTRVVREGRVSSHIIRLRFSVAAWSLCSFSAEAAL